MISLREWLSEPDKVARRGEVWGVVQLALELERRNTWRWRLWRWLTGSPIVNWNPFALWSRMTGQPQATVEPPATEPAPARPRGEEMPPEEERRIVTL
jgi:hypothetical protein